MGRIATFILIGISFIWALSAQAGMIRLGFLAADKNLGEVAQAAYEWAGENYTTTLLIADGKGRFRDSGGIEHPLTDFAVLWWHYSQTQNLPDVFLTDETKNAVKGYVELGGGLFLTALAVHYTFDIGIIKTKPRVFSPLGKNPPEIGVLPTDEGKKHPIFAGFDTSKPIFLCSMAQDGFTSDFMNVPELQEVGTVLATKTRGGGPGAGERPVVEFNVGKGKILTLGHHNSIYTDKKSDESRNLRKLTRNIIEYLAANSAFLPIEPKDKLAITWGQLKSETSSQTEGNWGVQSNRRNGSPSRTGADQGSRR